MFAWHIAAVQKAGLPDRKDGDLAWQHLLQST